MYSSKRSAAIHESIALGRILQEEIPEIADDYRNKLNATQIELKYKIRSTYGASSICVATTAVHYAIRGNYLRSFGQEYPGLIENVLELEELARNHNIRNGSRNGNRLKNQRRGIHLMTPEEKRRHGLEAAIARGEVPWVEDSENDVSEVVCAYFLTTLPEYQGLDGRYRSEEVARSLNERFHHGRKVRTGHAVYVKLSRI